ncbi:MAG TPA: hypothetical protein VKV77_01045 [Methylovirgula sp.]|nr:hypothetical protein [Methylovirgula sp.]
MDETEIYEYARQLLETHGGRAVAVAAQQASNFEQENDQEQAQIWRRIEAALKLLRGPTQG